MSQSGFAGPLVTQTDRWPCALQNCAPRAERAQARHNLPSSKRRLSHQDRFLLFLRLRAARRETVCGEPPSAHSAAPLYQRPSAPDALLIPPATLLLPRTQAQEPPSFSFPFPL